MLIPLSSVLVEPPPKCPCQEIRALLDHQWDNPPSLAYTEPYEGIPGTTVVGWVHRLKVRLSCEEGLRSEGLRTTKQEHIPFDGRGDFFFCRTSPPKVPGEHPTKMSTSGALPYFLGNTDLYVIAQHYY
jgi:hypothetical protein